MFDAFLASSGRACSRPALHLRKFCCPVQAAQDAADIASGKIKNAKGVTAEKANAAYEEAAKAAELAVKRAQDAAAETQETGKGIWQKASLLLYND